MELSRIVVRAVFAYLLLLLLMRLSGHRTIGQTTTQTFILILVLGDLIDDLLWAEVSASRFVVAAGTLVLLEVALSEVSWRSVKLQAWLEHVPTLLVRGGVVLRRILRKEHMSDQDLEHLLRLEQLEPCKMVEIRSAWLEKNGELGLLKRTWARRAQKQDLESLRRKRS
jgi:uncharacterized membrane protein YcaP (DUF421 family)